MACNFSVCNGQGKKALFLSASNGVESFCARQKALHPMAWILLCAMGKAKGAVLDGVQFSVYCLSKNAGKAGFGCCSKGNGPLVGSINQQQGKLQGEDVLYNAAAELGGRLFQQHPCIFWLLLALQRPNPGAANMANGAAAADLWLLNAHSS